MVRDRREKAPVAAESGRAILDFHGRSHAIRRIVAGGVHRLDSTRSRLDSASSIPRSPPIAPQSRFRRTRESEELASREISCRSALCLLKRMAPVTQVVVPRLVASRGVSWRLLVSRGSPGQEEELRD